MSRETVARSSCHSCGGDVAVKTTVSDKAYYTCDHCGFKAQHTWQRTSDAYLAKVKPKPAPTPTPTPAPANSSTATLPKPASLARGAGTVLG